MSLRRSSELSLFPVLCLPFPSFPFPSPLSPLMNPLIHVDYCSSSLFLLNSLPLISCHARKLLDTESGAALVPSTHLLMQPGLTASHSISGPGLPASSFLPWIFNEMLSCWLSLFLSSCYFPFHPVFQVPRNPLISG